jgi:prevent-host-death family protein
MFTYPEEDEVVYWQLQEAKAMFSEVVRSAAGKPQFITVHGKERAVVLSAEQYRKLSSPKESLVRFMEQSPWASVATELPKRQTEKMRAVEL